MYTDMSPPAFQKSPPRPKCKNVILGALQGGATAASLATLELHEQRDTLKVGGDPGRATGVSKPTQLLNPAHTDTRPRDSRGRAQCCASA